MLTLDKILELYQIFFILNPHTAISQQTDLMRLQ